MRRKMIKKPSFREEHKLWSSNIDYVIGIDEVGRGAFAGPIVGAGVIFRPNTNPSVLKGVNDSKLLTSKEREECLEIIKKEALFWTVESIEIDYINKFGIGKANTAVFRKVLSKLISQLSVPNYFVLIDGFHRRYLPGGIKKQKGIVGGDQKSLSIAGASIIAKVYRDNLMKEAASLYPEYRFELNKGYGTKVHVEALKSYGLSRLHRSAFCNGMSWKLD